MPLVGPSFTGVQQSCEPDGGRIYGTARTFASSTTGGANYLYVSLDDIQGNNYGTASGISPLAFDFGQLPDNDYYLTASDSSTEPPAQRNLNIACGPITPGGGSGGGTGPVCDLAITAVITTDNTVAGATTANYQGNGTITITATTSNPPLQYSFDNIDYSITQRGQSGVPYQLQSFGLTGGPNGFSAAQYRLYVKDSLGCVVNTMLTIADNIACNILVEVEIVEDIAFIRNVGAGDLEYDWAGLGVFADACFNASYKPGTYSVTARDKVTHSCTQTVQFTVAPYPSPLICCAYALVIKGQWFPIMEPLHLDDEELAIKRDNTRHGVSFEYAELPLGFNCHSGRDLINAQRDLLGDDAEIGFIELQRDQDHYPKMMVVYTGKLNLYDYSDTAGVLTCNVDSSGLAKLLASRQKTSVDLAGFKNLDGGYLSGSRTVKTALHSKALVKVGHYTADGSYADSGTIQYDQREAYIVFGFGVTVVDGLDDFYQQVSGFSYTQQKYPFFKAKEAGAAILEFKIDAQVTVARVKEYFHEVYLELYFQINNNPAQQLVAIHADNLGTFLSYGSTFNSDNHGGGYRASGTRSLNLAVGDELYLWGKLFIEDAHSKGEFQMGMLLDKSSFVKITSETLGPDSTAYMYPVYEALDRGLEIALGTPGLLRSNYYGRLDSKPRAYAQAGAGSQFVLGTGFMIRGIGGKPFAPSFNDMLDGLHPIHCIGMAVQPDDLTGEDVVRIEKAEDFYEDRLALRVDSCAKFTRKSDPTRQPNVVNIGFDKWQPEGRVENALDEPNAKRQYATPTRLNAVEYKQQSKFIGGSYLLEAERRLGTSDTDGKNDNDTFIISVLSTEVNKTALAWTYNNLNMVIVEGSSYADNVNTGDQIIIVSGPNAGAYTATGVFVDNSGNTGVPNAYALLLSPVLPDPTAPLGVQVIVGQSYRARKDEGFAVVQNLYSPATAYNLVCTPARNARRHGRVLNSGTWFKQPGELYRSTYAEGNLNLVTRLIGELNPVVESADIARSDLAPLGETIFVPEQLTFESFLDRDGFNKLRSRRHGYIAVFDGEQWFTGFILSVKWKRAKDKGTFQLLRRAGSFDPNATSGLREFNSAEFNDPEFN